MLRKIAAVTILAAMTAAFVAAPATAKEGEESKHATKDVMKVAFKGGLLKKVAGGDASDEEKAKLHAMLVSLSKNKAKKGEADSWKKLTSALVKASKAVVAGEADAGKALTKAANCKACHNLHK